MSDFGPKRKGTAQRGRPRKRPDYDREKEIENLVQQAVTLFSLPFDDRDERPPDAPSINSVAQQMNISRVKVRKLLITADYYSSAASREIQKLHGCGLSIDQICERTGLKKQTVNSLLPYRKGAYNLEDPPQFAEKCRTFRKRKRACEQLSDRLDDTDCCQILWKAILAFEQYPFRTEEGRSLKYSIDCERLRMNERIYSRKEIEDAYHRIRRVLRTEGCITKANCCCCEELYTVFLRIGACNR